MEITKNKKKDSNGTYFLVDVTLFFNGSLTGFNFSSPKGLSKIGKNCWYLWKMRIKYIGKNSVFGLVLQKIFLVWKIGKSLSKSQQKKSFKKILEILYCIVCIGNSFQIFQFLPILQKCPWHSGIHEHMIHLLAILSL